MAGLDADTMLHIDAGFDQQSGYHCMSELLTQCPELDGVVCATDTIAIGALHALRDAGRCVPEDVSLAGVGDSWAGTITEPKLTTVHLYQSQVGVEAARMLLQMIERPKTEGPVRQMSLGYTLVERGSI
jgi:LacI family sucrose operon transcriptional repressor